MALFPVGNDVLEENSLDTSLEVILETFHNVSTLELVGSLSLTWNPTSTRPRGNYRGGRGTEELHA